MKRLLLLFSTVFLTIGCHEPDNPELNCELTEVGRNTLCVAQLTPEFRCPVEYPVGYRLQQIAVCSTRHDLDEWDQQIAVENVVDFGECWDEWDCTVGEGCLWQVGESTQCVGVAPELSFTTVHVIDETEDCTEESTGIDIVSLELHNENGDRVAFGELVGVVAGPGAKVDEVAFESADFSDFCHEDFISVGCSGRASFVFNAQNPIEITPAHTIIVNEFDDLCYRNSEPYRVQVCTEEGQRCEQVGSSWGSSSFWLFQ